MRIFFIALVLITISCKNTTEKTTDVTATTEELVTVELKIEGMTCTGCEGTIETNVLALEGISSVEAVHTSGSAHISSEVSLLDTTLIKETIESSGYQVVSIAILE